MRRLVLRADNLASEQLDLSDSLSLLGLVSLQNVDYMILQIRFVAQTSGSILEHFEIMRLFHEMGAAPCK